MADAVFKLDLIGDKELDRALADLERNVQRKVMRKAMRESFRLVLRATKDFVPKRTGTLRRLIKMRALPRSRTSIGIGVFMPTREELGISSADPNYWPAALEYGHAAPYDAGGDKVVRQRSFMRTGFDANRERVWNRFHRLLWRGVLRVSKGRKP